MTFFDILMKECEFKTAWDAALFFVIWGAGRMEIAGVTADWLGHVIIELTAYEDRIYQIKFQWIISVHITAEIKPLWMW